MFLDIDGVINGYLRKDQELYCLCELSQTLVDRVKRIIDVTKCEVILTSTWRFDECIDKIMEHCGISYIDSTNISSCRGQEIKDWLETRGPCTYCILEDSEALLVEQEEHVVWTSPYYGISEEQVQLAINILNNEETSSTDRSRNKC